MDSPPVSPLHEPAGDLSEPGVVPAPAVWGVVGMIVVFAAIGAYRGLVSVGPGAPGSSLLSPESLATGKPVEAAPAVPLPHNPEWSTLNGPQILTPPPAKPVSKPAAEDAAPPSDDAPDAADAAADAQSQDTPAKAPNPDDKSPPPAAATDAHSGPTP